VKLASAQDFLNIPVQNFRADESGTAPSAPSMGQLWTDTSVSPAVVRWFDGTDWVAADGTSIPAGHVTNQEVAAGAGLELSKLAVDVLDRSRHTGTQTAATISDFTATVRTSRLDELAPPTLDVDLGAVTVTGVGDPQAPNDLAHKAYVDQARAGIVSVKDPVRVVAQTHVDLEAPGATVDDIALTVGDRFLAPVQVTPEENGIYIFTGPTSPADRAPDADDETELVDGTLVAVAEGTDAGKQFIHFWGET
jgi:hypothetical protein